MYATQKDLAPVSGPDFPFVCRDLPPLRLLVADTRVRYVDRMPQPFSTIGDELRSDYRWFYYRATPWQLANDNYAADTFYTALRGIAWIAWIAGKILSPLAMERTWCEQRVPAALGLTRHMSSSIASSCLLVERPKLAVEAAIARERTLGKSLVNDLMPDCPFRHPKLLPTCIASSFV